MGRTKKMIDKDFEQIALILNEAERFGLRWEDITIKERTQPTTLELFKQLIEVKVPIDAWLDSMPEDIDEWKVEYELIDHTGKVEYRCLTRFYDLEDDFIVNAVIESRTIHD